MLHRESRPELYEERVTRCCWRWPHLRTPLSISLPLPFHLLLLMARGLRLIQELPWLAHPCP